MTMPGFNYDFDATQYEPQQGGGGHPEGKFPFVISNTEIVPIKDDPDGRPRFVVEFETPSGKIKNGYNLWSSNQQAVDISHKQLSALSYATGIFRLTMRDAGAALRGARGMIEVGKQRTGDYVEVKKVFDVNGNEPGKAPAPAQQQQPQPQTTAMQPAPQAPTTAWGAPAAQQPQPAQPAPAASPWVQQAPSTAAPPWANK